ncbi:uncharacterized protein THITE_151239 [Thermothielavioides terrestris NRRL 8126]|uniref:Uncharacterized protein n=1 Tax=Thermothielavioides terrestris (strain ATCC 38088 / NRRL 8126) TaxID=578455 RepID=G2R079_THETT|nr:uncharacterized protein THITE_151239 [Thermothielavioides terrestris NRRL 8126]AEO67247.1 hypothetical protein THITE_151239 [Thermothielavioides terrestris NRRL 8126]
MPTVDSASFLQPFAPCVHREMFAPRPQCGVTAAWQVAELCRPSIATGVRGRAIGSDMQSKSGRVPQRAKHIASLASSRSKAFAAGTAAWAGEMDTESHSIHHWPSTVIRQQLSARPACLFFGLETVLVQGGLTLAPPEKTAKPPPVLFFGVTNTQVGACRFPLIVAILPEATTQQAGPSAALSMPGQTLASMSQPSPGPPCMFVACRRRSPTTDKRDRGGHD